MAHVKLLPLLGAALFVLGNAAHGNAASPGQGTTTTYTVVLDQEGVCLSDIDGVREKAGFGKFARPTEPTKQLPTSDNTGKQWDRFCQDVLADKGSKTSVSSGDDGATSAMYSMVVLKSSKVDCTAVVDHWKGANKNFTGIPPAPEKSSGLYDDADNVMFISLFTPSAGATADCRVVTCTESTSTADPPKKTERKGYAFLCMTTPNMLGDGAKQPFTKEEWEKISAVFKASAQAVVPSVFFVLLVALGGILL